MKEATESKMTVVTSPDYHVEPGSYRIAIFGSHSTHIAVQDIVADWWPQSDVTLYRVSNPSPATSNVEKEIDWIYYHTYLADSLIVHYNQIGRDLIYSLMFKADRIFIVYDEILGDSLRLLNLTFPNRVFLNVDDAVKAVIAAAK